MGLLNSKTTMQSGLHIDQAFVDVKAKTVSQFMATMSKFMAPILSKDSKNLYKKLSDEAKQQNIAVGDSVAVIQIKAFNQESPRIFIASTPDGIDAKAPDGKRIRVFCVVCVPAGESSGESLRRLSRISRLLKNHDVYNGIVMASDPQTIQSIVMNPDGLMLAA